MAEELGFDHAWLVDHLTPTDRSPDEPIHEAWTLLAAIAARTERIRLGVLVTSNTFRNPALLAKSAVTVDHISGGRLILGLGAGWHEDEHRRYGIDLPAPAERVDRLEEAVRVIVALQDGGADDVRRAATIDSTTRRSAPKPLQRPRIPLLIAAHRPRMIRLAARYADMWDTFPELPGTATDGVTTSVAERMEAFEAACLRSGRESTAIRRSTWAEADVGASEDAFVDFARRHHALGFTDISVIPPGSRDLPTLRRTALERIPELRAEFAR